MGPPVDPDQQQLIVQCVTTEHFALQSARAAIATETIGRATIYLSTVSSAIIAMAFLGQTLQLNLVFVLISVILIVALFFLGIVTCIRLWQLGIDDTTYQRAINRLRHWYLEQAPAMRPYFMLSDHDDMPGVLQNLTITPSGWQLIFTTSGAITVINSLLGAVGAGLIVHAIIGGSLLSSILLGGVVGIGSAVLFGLMQVRMWEHAEQHMPVLFPSPTMDDGPQVPA